MFKSKNALKLSILFFIMFFAFSGQTSLEAQMKELNRLQAQLEALQSGVKQENEHSVEKANKLGSTNEPDHNANSSNRYQLVDVDYRQYNPLINGYTELKSVMKIDLKSGETWLFVIEGQNGYWKRIAN